MKRVQSAALRLRSSYCSLAHGKVLSETFAEDVPRLAGDYRDAGLDPSDVAVMELAARVVDDASSIGPEHLQPLRELGLSEADVFDVILAAAARCFFSKALDAMGTLPDAEYALLPADLRSALVVGRPIAGGLTPDAAVGA